MREILDVTIFGGFTLINHKLAPVTALVSHVHKRKPPAGITWTIILFNLALPCQSSLLNICRYTSLDAHEVYPVTLDIRPSSPFTS